MSEYWVSQAKYYCKVCNVYIADNKPSRQHHENGVKHKEKVEQMLKQKRLDKLHGARSEAELKKQLDEINKAASAAIASDRMEQDGNFYQNSGFRPRPPPPPPGSHLAGYQQTSENGEADLLGEQEEEDSTGIYTVKGQTYLQGKIHEEKIRSGMQCEVFLEELDEWLPAVVLARHENPVPYTTIVLASFDVEYALPSPAATEEHGDVAGVSEMVQEKSIKSDRLRLFGKEDGTVLGGEINNADSYGSCGVPQIQLNENTGIGMWQTVSVREVDDEAERAENARLMEEMFNRRDDQNASTSKRPSVSMDKGVDDGDDSALSAYDPYGRNKHVYRGIRLHEDTDRKTQIESVAQGATVSFKKRKTASNPPASASSSAVAAVQGAITTIKNEEIASSNPHSSSSSAAAAVVEVSEHAVGVMSEVKVKPAAENNSTLETVQGSEPTAPVTVLPYGKVSLKMSNGGAKRKFRVREPSP